MSLGFDNITVTAVRNTLGETTNKVSALCRSNKINKFSWWRPVNGPWPEGTNGNHGFIIPTAVRLPFFYSSFASGYGTDGYDWKIETVNICRLGDFRRYDHSAQRPKFDYVEGSGFTYVDINGNQQFDVYSMGGFNDKYLGCVCINPSDTSQVKIVTLSKKISELNDDIEVIEVYQGWYLTTVNGWTCYPVVCNVPIPNAMTDAEATTYIANHNSHTLQTLQWPSYVMVTPLPWCKTWTGTGQGDWSGEPGPAPVVPYDFTVRGYLNGCYITLAQNGVYSSGTCWYLDSNGNTITTLAIPSVIVSNGNTITKANEGEIADFRILNGTLWSPEYSGSTAIQKVRVTIGNVTHEAIARGMRTIQL